jgi:hypothetical protein
MGPGVTGSDEVAGVSVMVGASGRSAHGVEASWHVALARGGISMKNEAGRASGAVVGELAGESAGVGAKESDRAAGE